jgi:hypothetical protein
VVRTFKQLLSCDKAVAERDFERFMVRASDMETLVPLTLAAIDSEVYGAVWKMLGRVPYEYHVPLAEGVGAACQDHANVVPFLQGAHASLKGTEFVSWEPALSSCKSPDLGTWMESLVLDPPKSPYNDKYNAIITTFAKIRRVESIPTLEQAAITVAERGGPFNNIVETLQRSVEGESYRDKADPADTAEMEASLVRVAKKASPEQARLVADRLYTAGNEQLAASLLPAIYPDRVQADGSLLWAGAAVEACDGAAWIHWTSFTAQPTFWSVIERVQDPLRGAKARLKCTAEDAWPVFAPDAPLAGKDATEEWVNTLVADWEAKGMKVKATHEKKVTIQ